MGKSQIGKPGRHLGFKHSKETRLKISKNRKGKMVGTAHFNFKGKYKTVWGYMMIYAPNHPLKDCRNMIFEHRLVAEKYLGKYLKKSERIHHINGNKLDNKPENLYLFENESAHQVFHHKNKKSILRIKSNIIQQESSLF